MYLESFINFDLIMFYYCNQVSMLITFHTLKNSCIHIEIISQNPHQEVQS